MKPRHQAWGTNAASSLLAAFFLAACEQAASPTTTPVALDSLCVDSTCGEKTVLLSIPDAENLLFTPEGRLFVSGGRNVYEISRSGDSYQAQPLLDGSDNFTGLALRGDVLYANGFSGTLYAGRLEPRPSLQAIHDLGLTAANGLATGPDGELYAVNGPAALAPKIVRLRLDPADPFKVVEQSDWLSFTPGSSFPNGIQVRGRTLYFSESTLTALGRIRKLTIASDGQPGTPETVASLGASLPDDFSLVGDAILAAYFTDGRIGLFSPEGQLLAQTGLGSFQSPSQVRLGQPPLFAATDLLVTEKGILGENDSAIGNVLSVFRRKRD
ncbi:MAG: hypothetical protein EPO48_12810 [Nevskiaceae bacterium]|nr:MAG: hypothetical protein EPO48_12810 [Nevskiaceae bacterium]